MPWKTDIRVAGSLLFNNMNTLGPRIKHKKRKDSREKGQNKQDFKSAHKIKKQGGLENTKKIPKIPHW